MNTRVARIDIILTAVLVCCAVTTTSLVARREYVAWIAAQPRQAAYVPEWRTALDSGGGGVLLGSRAAPVQIIEFADFQCPYCASFKATLKALRERYPQQVAVTFAHFPLDFHPLAEPAARATECARSSGDFEVMHDYIFDNHASLGQQSWDEMARRAGVRDLGAFASCMSSDEPVAPILRQREIGIEAFGVSSTPTVVVNGWVLPRIPTAEDLDRMVNLVLEGREPVEKQRWWSRLFS